MSELPIIDCNDCGACCAEQCSPPMFLYWLLNPDADGWGEDEDAELVRGLPPEARRELQEYADRLLSYPPRDDGPCIWLDQQTKRCRWYEHRPTICRELDVGSESCRGWRDEYNIDVESLFAEHDA